MLDINSNIIFAIIMLSLIIYVLSCYYTIKSVREYFEKDINSHLMPNILEVLFCFIPVFNTIYATGYLVTKLFDGNVRCKILGIDPENRTVR